MQFSRGTFVGRIWREDLQGPSVVTIRNGHVVDITSKQAPTMRDLLEMSEPAEFAATATGCDLGELQASEEEDFLLLAPIDLQAIKACGVTFAQSMVERVVEERAGACHPKPPESGRQLRKLSAGVCVLFVPVRKKPNV